MTNPIEVLEQAEAALAELAALPLAHLTDDTLLQTTTRAEQVGRLIDSVRVQAAAEITERSRDELGSAGLAIRNGHRRPTGLIEYLTRTSAHEARRRVTLGRLVRPRTQFDGQVLVPEFPLVATAMRAGTMGIDAAAQVTRILDSAQRGHAMPEGVTAAEEALVDSAAFLSADLVRTQAEVWRAALDPDGAEPRDQKAFAKRSARTGTTIDGLTPLTLMVTSPDLALINAMWDEAGKFGSQPRFLPADATNATDATGPAEIDPATGEPVYRDPRSRLQRQYDVLIGNIRAGLRCTETGDSSGGGRSLATVNVLITARDFQTGHGVGWIDGISEPVSAGTVRQMADQAGFTPIVLDENNALAATTPRQRFFSPKMRQQIIARDGPGCIWGHTGDDPPGALDAHHVVEYAKGGRTEVDNGVMICPPHHRFLDYSGYRMEMRNGTPWLLAPYPVDPTQTWRKLGKNRAAMTQKLETLRDD